MFSGGLVPVRDCSSAAEVADVVEQPAGLVLSGDESGEGEQALLVVAALDDAWDEAQALAVLVGDDLHLADVESEVMEPADPLLDLPHLVGRELLDRGQLAPQVRIAGLDVVGDGERVDVGDESPAGLEVEQSARHVLVGDVEIEPALPVGEVVVALARLDVDDVRRERSRISAEQRVGQRAVTPEEARDVQPHEQADQRVQQSVAEVRDGQPAARQQAAVRQGVVEVARDEEPVAATRSLGDDGDDGRRREPILGEAAQEAVLAQGQVGRAAP